MLPEDGAYSSLHTEKGYSLDVSSYKERGEDLHTAIQDAVRDTQSVVVRAYPDKLILSASQYKDLANRPQIIDLSVEGQEYFIYRTKHNVMEVEVKD